MKKIRKAVIPAAGLGTRFLPATKAQPKEMLPIVDKPTIQYIVEEAVASGIEEILIITGRSKRAIEDHFDKAYELETELEKKGKETELEIVRSVSSLANVLYIRQKEQKGLGDAIDCAKIFCENEPFAVLLGDNIVDNSKPALQQLIEIYEEYNGSVLGVQEVEPSKVNKYGIVDGVSLNDKLMEVNNLIEKPAIGSAPTNFAMLGRYILTPEIFESLNNIEAGYGGELQLTDAILDLTKKEKVYSYCYEGKTYDIGDKLGFMIAEVDFALKDKEIGEKFKDYLKYVLGV